MTAKELPPVDKDEEGCEIGFRDAADAVWRVDASGLLIFDDEMSDGALRTLLAIIYFARRYGSSWPGQERLAVCRGVSSRTIRSHVVELVERGLLYVERRGKGRTNKYWVEPLRTVYAEPAVQAALEKTEKPMTGRNLPVGQEENFLSDRKKSSWEVPKGEEPKGKNPKVAGARSARPAASEDIAGKKRSTPSGKTGSRVSPAATRLQSRQTEGPIGLDPLDPEVADAEVTVLRVDTEFEPTTKQAGRLKELIEEGWSALSRRVACTRCGKPKVTRWRDPQGNYACPPFDGCKGLGRAGLRAVRAQADRAEKKVPTGIKLVWDTYWREVAHRTGSSSKPKFMSGKQGGQIKTLLEQHEFDDVEKMIRLAVWDWEAIKEEWKRAWKSGSSPTLDDLVSLRDDLVLHIGRGVTSSQHRVSKYVQKFLGGKTKVGNLGGKFRSYEENSA